MNNILIVEDDVIQRENLKKLLSEIYTSLNLYEAESQEEAMEISKKVPIDIFYIDVSLKDSSGIDFAKELRKIKRYEFTWIVFITTHIQYMIQAFKEIHCYDFIIKPYEKKDIVSLTERLISGSNSNKEEITEEKSIVFDVQDGISIKIYTDEIIFISVSLRNAAIHTVNGKYEIKGIGLKKILELIDCENIIQSFRSFIVNTKHISKIQSIDSKVSEIYFKDYSEKAILGYTFKNAVLEKFKQG
ncbi:MAG: LytR/AlgR family response regulator transcription factor [Clostridiaceae bacterium]